MEGRVDGQDLHVREDAMVAVEYRDHVRLKWNNRNEQHLLRPQGQEADREEATGLVQSRIGPSLVFR